jgi:pimeloyl-ACP methyl ester carboxylesterase
MLIKTYKLEKPDVIAHFVTSTQVALNLALQYPDKIGKVVIIGGAPYRYYAGQKNGQWNDWENEMRLTRLQREQLVEKYWAPKWFKTVTKVTWDANMWAPEDYCINSKQGKKLFKKSAAVALPVMVRYLLEWMVYDINDSYSKIVNPTLVLTPDFDGLIQFAESEERKANDVSVKKYLRYFHLEAWRPAILACNNQLKFQMISHSRLFTWIDNPGMTFKCIDEFLGN